MATIACPHCGKPLRPGARFCGSCGKEVTPSDLASAKAPAVKPADAQQAAPACPHCGQPLRSGARFCNACGKSIAAPTAASAPEGAPPVQPAANALPQAAQQTTGSHKPVSPDARRLPVEKPAKAEATSTAKPKRAGLRLGMILGLLILCVGVTVGGFFVVRAFFPDLLAVLTTPTLEVIPSTGTATPVDVQEPTLEPTASQPSIDTPTETPSQPSPTKASSQTPMATPAPTLSPAPTGRDLIDEDFSVTPLTNWDLWSYSQPRPVPTRSGDNFYLKMTAGDFPTQAGATSNLAVPYDDNVVIEFTASLNAQQPLMFIFDWDPINFDRKKNSDPGSNSDGDGDDGIGNDDGPFFPPLFPNSLLDQQAANTVGIRLIIQRNEITLYFPGMQVCKAALTGAVLRTYQIRVQPGSPRRIDLLVDGQSLSSCPGDVAEFAFTGGKISFTGHGELYSVKVIVP